MACFDVTPLHLPGGILPNQSERNLTDLRVEIWTLDILNMKHNVNHYNGTTEKSYVCGYIYGKCETAKNLSSGEGLQ
jgi:hypothetical protein